MEEMKYEEEDMSTSSVNIQMMDLNWLERKNYDFLDLIKTLSLNKNKAIY